MKSPTRYDTSPRKNNQPTGYEGKGQFLGDLPTYMGDPKLFLDWILKIKKVAQFTG